MDVVQALLTLCWQLKWLSHGVLASEYHKYLVKPCAGNRSFRYAKMLL